MQNKFDTFQSLFRLNMWVNKEDTAELWNCYRDLVWSWNLFGLSGMNVIFGEQSKEEKSRKSKIKIFSCTKVWKEPVITVKNSTLCEYFYCTKVWKEPLATAKEKYFMWMFFMIVNYVWEIPCKSNETLFYNVICDFTTYVGGGIYE